MWASYSSRNHLQRAQHRVGRGLAQAAERGLLDGLGQLLQVEDALEAQQGVDARLLAARAGDGLEDLQHAARALAAGDALAAALVLDELHEELGQVHHAGALVHHHQAAGAHDGAEATAGTRSRSSRPSGWPGMQPPEGPPICAALNFLPRGTPPPISLNDQSRREVPMGTSTRPVLAHHARPGRRPWCPCCSRCRCRRTRRRRDLHDAAGRCEGLHVVDDGGLAEQARLRREGRPGPRHAALALDGVHQGGLLAADEGAGAHLDDDVQVEAAAQDVLAQQAVLACAWAMAIFRFWMARGYSARSRCRPWLAPMA